MRQLGEAVALKPQNLDVRVLGQGIRLDVGETLVVQIEAS